VTGAGCRADQLEQIEVNVMSGRVVHFEIPFADGDRARSFYQSAFGWNLMPIPEMSYTIVSTGPTGEQGPSEPGYIGGGMLARTDLFQGPVITVDVDDIDSALAKVEELGGTTVRPRQEVGQMGFAAYFTDPEGNLMGLWQTAPSTL
jgi:predicted enzyme related to lactoylglutathione lyase